MTAELWLHRPCVHGHEGSFRTHPPVAEMLRGDELPCEGGRPRVRLNPDTVMLLTGVFVEVREEREVTSGYGLAEVTVQDIIDALEEE